jgi:hypothetical protein
VLTLASSMDATPQHAAQALHRQLLATWSMPMMQAMRHAGRPRSSNQHRQATAMLVDDQTPLFVTAGTTNTRAWRIQFRVRHCFVGRARRIRRSGDDRQLLQPARSTSPITTSRGVPALRHGAKHAVQVLRIKRPTNNKSVRS